MEDDNIVEVVQGPVVAESRVIDLSGDDGEETRDPFDLKPGTVVEKPSEEITNKIEDKPAEPAAGEEKKEDTDKPALPDGEGEKGSALPEKFVELFSEFVEDPDFKDLPLEDGKKLVTDMIKSRTAFDQMVREFASDKEQYIEMSNLMDEDKDLAEHVWNIIDRKKKGLPMLKTQEELEAEKSLTPEQIESRDRLLALEQDSKSRKVKEDVEYYRKKIDEVHEAFRNPETKQSPLTENDIDNIADIAIRFKTDDLMGVAKEYLRERQWYIDQAVEAARAKFKEEVKPDIIKEYLALKEEDRQKIVDSSIKPATPPPAAPQKRLSLDDDSAKKGFLASIRAGLSSK